MSEKNLDQLRNDFPILKKKIHNNFPLIYLDSAASSQKPDCVIESISNTYSNSYANIHRGIHKLAEEATLIYETSREKIGLFINSSSPKNIIFTRNTTESINLVANSWGRSNLKAGDLIILTEMEHHSNLVPWQILAQTIGVHLEFIPMSSDYLLDLEIYKLLLEKSPKLVAFTHMSNVLGTINPAAEIIKLAHHAGALTLVDGAQSVPHFPVDVQAMDVDFLAFSGHKMCGPSGIGVLFGRKDLLENMPPFLGGGDMIKRVELRSFSTNEVPYKFEAGTPAIVEAIGLGTAVDYLSNIGMEIIEKHEQELVRYSLERLSEVTGITVYGPKESHRGGVVSFTLDGIHPHDVSQVLDTYGIAVRAGHHCAMPLHEKLNITASTRVSFYLYNNHNDIDMLVKALFQVKKIFGV